MIGCHHAQTHHDSQLTLTKIPEPQPARRDDRIDGGRRVGRLAVGDYLVGPRVEGAVASAEAGARLLIEACVVSHSLVCKTQASGCKTLASDEQGGVLPQNCVCAGKAAHNHCSSRRRESRAPCIDSDPATQLAVI